MSRVGTGMTSAELSRGAGVAELVFPEAGAAGEPVVADAGAAARDAPEAVPLSVRTNVRRVVSGRASGTGGGRVRWLAGVRLSVAVRGSGDGAAARGGRGPGGGAVAVPAGGTGAPGGVALGRATVADELAPALADAVATDESTTGSAAGEAGASAEDTDCGTAVDVAGAPLGCMPR